MRIVAEHDGDILTEALSPYWVEDATFVPKETWGFILRDDNDAVVGGVGGNLKTKWGWCYVQSLMVAPEHRNGDWGTKLMEQAEAFARGKGLKGIWLTTLSFQALEFYKKLGYVEFGRLDDCPPGAALVMLCKRF